MALQLFDFVKILFSKDGSYENLPDNEKNRNFFMTQRFMSIKFPVQANALNHFKVEGPSVMDCWHRTMVHLSGGKVPPWIYAKTKKKETKEEKLKLPSEAFVKWYCQKNECSRRDYDQLVKFFGNAFTDEQLKFEKVLRSQGILQD